MQGRDGIGYRMDVIRLDDWGFVWYSTQGGHVLSSDNVTGVSVSLSMER